MTTPRSLNTLAWILPLLVALGVVFTTASLRIERIETMSRLGAETVGQPDLPTLLVPLHARGSYEWIAQAKQARATGAWRIREVDYDNATAGRATDLASPYRWWLQTVATVNGWMHPDSPAVAMERALLWAGPALQMLVLLLLVPWSARAFGAGAAGLLALGWVACFPLNTFFLPGQPNDLGLKAAVLLTHGLFLLHGVATASGDPTRGRRWFVFAGIMGGLGCWLHVASQLPLIVGVLLAAAIARRRGAEAITRLPWRHWAGAGAAVAVAAWLFEYAPDHLDAWRLNVNHPLYALAWFAAADLLARTSLASAARVRTAVAALLVLAPLIVMLATGSFGFPGANANLNQLSGLRQNLSAASLGDWWTRDGITLPLAATLLVPLLAAAIAFAAARGALPPASRLAAGLLLGPVVIWIGLAVFQLYAWALLDATVLALLVAAAVGAPSIPRPRRHLITGVVALALLPGCWLAWPRGGSQAEVTAEEVEALVARDIAHTLTRRAGEPGAVVLAPPALSTALIHYGDLRGVTTSHTENQDGLAAAARILGTTSADEALALAERREIRFIVLPTWDSTLEQLARVATDNFDQTLAGLLQQWLPPRWLRPVPYELPGIAGIETRAAMIFEVVEAQDNPTALARLAEYFLEMGQPQLATPVAAALKQAFPQELSALAGRLQVEMARRDVAAVNASVAVIEAQLALNADEILPWERRVSLALSLAQARQMPLARPLLVFSLETADDDHLRSLTPGTLYRLLAVTDATHLAWPSDDLRRSALALLPPEWRERR